MDEIYRSSYQEPEADMTSIDLSTILKKIERRYPDVHRNEGAARCLRQLWSFPDVNDCGVFNEIEDAVDICLKKGSRQWRAVVSVSVAPNGWHAIATQYDYDIGGGGYAPSIWNKGAYETRQEAIEDGDFGILIWPSSAVCFGPPSNERVL